MNNNILDIQSDINAISQISAVPTILEVICRTTGMGFAAVARVTDEKWIALCVRDEIKFGLVPGGELKLETTICHEIRQSGEGVIIDHVAEDPAFCDHHTPAMYGFQSYISLPIIKKDGTFFGTLCAIDPNPAKLKTPETIGMFKLYAELISFHLNALEELAETESRLVEEKQTAELREQFIAVLGHDLRNPIGAVKNVAQLLQRGQLDEERVKRWAGILQNSSYRMMGLIDNVMDFARGRLGSGITLNGNYEVLDKTLAHVIDELRVIWPERVIQEQFDLQEAVYCDSKRVAQLFSNLLSNAISHGAEDMPVNITASSDSDAFTLTVTNYGTPIPDNTMKRLFQPFARGIKSGHEGLGLGLYIADQIAIAHYGAIGVTSTNQGTSFTLTIPNKNPQ